LLFTEIQLEIGNYSFKLLPWIREYMHLNMPVLCGNLCSYLTMHLISITIMFAICIEEWSSRSTNRNYVWN